MCPGMEVERWVGGGCLVKVLFFFWDFGQMEGGRKGGGFIGRKRFWKVLGGFGGFVRCGLLVSE